MLVVRDPLDIEAEHNAVEARIGELMGTINMATAELVSVIADVIEHGTWETASGMRSIEHWVTWQCGVSHARAEALVKMARRRVELPLTTAVFDSGQVSEDTMAVIARRVPTEFDEVVAEQAGRLLHSQVSRMVKKMPKPAPASEKDEPVDSVVFWTDGERWHLRANLSVDEGAVVEKAIVAARTKVFFERHSDAEVETRSGVTWADGLVRAAELALQTADGRDRRSADRFQVMVHFDVADNTARLHLGDVLPDALRRYLMCDADIRAAIEDNGTLAALTSKLRTVDDKMRAYLEQRDGGCVVPGCEQKRWLHAHHLVHWEDGGKTQSCNLCCLCPLHHRLHHLGLLDIRGNPESWEGLQFFDHKGRPIGAVTKVPPEHPLHPPPKNYVHPSGEHVDWHWFDWRIPNDSSSSN